MPQSLPAALRTLHAGARALMARDTADMTARQICVLMECYGSAVPQTVRGLAAKLNVSKPAITRAVIKLEEMNMLRRKVDPLDRRSVNIMRTDGGERYLFDLEADMRRPVKQ